MTYSLEEFCTDCRTALTEDPGAGGREKIRVQLEKLLENEEFVQTHLPPQGSGKTALYHDPETDVHVMAHGTDEGNRTGKPHCHGASWAVYGQGDESAIKLFPFGRVGGDTLGEIGGEHEGDDHGGKGGVRPVEKTPGKQGASGRRYQ